MIRRVEQKKMLTNIYLITLAANPENQLDIMPAGSLHFPYLERSCPLIIGIAAGYEEALELVGTIVTEVYQQTGDVRIRDYLETGK
ncbi:MAG: hypothetical protein PHE06_02500 [Lachnospiraceae bacterium]|nr:hypothetical protein [Lachnospiraceae bacterium]